MRSMIWPSVLVHWKGRALSFQVLVQFSSAVVRFGAMPARIGVAVVQAAVRRMRACAVACPQLIEAASSRSGYACLVEGSRGGAGGSLRLAAALVLASLGALVCGQFGVACGGAGSGVMAGRCAGSCGDARHLAAFV